MMRVQLVVTGKCEQALGHSLASIFPSLEWAEPIFANAFTTSSLDEPIPAGLMRTIDKFVLQLIRQTEERADQLVIGIDDLERNSPQSVEAALRSSIERVLADPRVANSQGKRDRLRAGLASRCSFHLLRPMVEAYFFGEPAALRRAGATRTSLFDASLTDCEQFAVVDPDFTTPPDTMDKDDWRRGGPTRFEHPKRYLKFLTSDLAGLWTYSETVGGRAALRSLNWRSVTSAESFVTAIRALLNDIAAFASLPTFSGAELRETSFATHRAQRTLRNL